MSSSHRCHLLDHLPPELRLRIYEHIFHESYQTLLLIKSDAKIELISPAKAPTALLKTCRAIHTEAAPVLYSKTTFRVQIYPEGGFSRHGNINRLHASAPWLERIQHLEIKSCVFLPTHPKPALRLMSAFAEALEDAGADIKTLHARSELFPLVSEPRLQTYQEMVVLLNEDREHHLEKRSLLQRMLETSSGPN